MDAAKPMKIAVLVTCHNRRDSTLCSLSAWFAAAAVAEVDSHVFLVDDGSVDGTADAVTTRFANVSVLTGDGNLYWAGGTRKAFAAALDLDFDAYVWLNDDTFLFPDAVRIAIRSEASARKHFGRPALVVGSVVDPDTGQLTYGGRVSRGWLRPLYYDLVPPAPTPQLCDTVNGNFVMIPREIARAVGNLDPVYTHGRADYDYGWKVGRDAGFPVVVADTVVGQCAKGERDLAKTLEHMSVAARWRHLTGPKNFPPREWLIYTRRHAGPFWPLHWLRPYLRVFF